MYRVYFTFTNDLGEDVRDFLDNNGKGFCIEDATSIAQQLERQGCRSIEIKDEEEAKWYAVQASPGDDWGFGSYDFDEATEMAMNTDAKLIAVISGDVCVEEIPMYDAFRVSAVFADGSTVDNDIVFRTGERAIETEIAEAREWFADKEPREFLVSYYRDGECFTNEVR